MAVADPVTIGGVMHYNDQGDTANWIGYPVRVGNVKFPTAKFGSAF